MRVIFTLIGRLFLLFYIQARRILPLPLRRRVFGIIKWCVPESMRGPYRRWSTQVRSLNKEDGFRGLSFQFFGHFQEFWGLLKWLWADDVRPSLSSAIIPTGFKFAATMCQAATFAVVAGYISLATQDWTFALRGYSFVLEPTSQNILMLSGAVLATYTAFAVFNYIGGNLMLNVGLTYQERISERLLKYYREVSLDPTKGEYIDSALLLSVINTECRYLGRVLIMLYNMIYQFFFAFLGLAILVRLDVNFAYLCLGFVFLSLLFQVGVMGKTLNDTRSMLGLSDANTAALRKAISAISLSPRMFELSPEDVSGFIDRPAVHDYNDSYYDRLRIGLFASMIPQLLFAIFIAGVFAYAVYAIYNYGIDASSAIQYVFSIRFFLGGITGILVGFVSIISFKPYFDNYIKIIDTRARSGSDEENDNDDAQSERRAPPVLGETFPLYVSTSEIVNLNRGESISVVVNKGSISWLDVAFIMKLIGGNPTSAPYSLHDNISIVHTDLPLLENDPYRSFGFASKGEFVNNLSKIPFWETELGELSDLLKRIVSDPAQADALWAKMPLNQLVAGSLLAAIGKPNPILIIGERAFRAVPERARKTIFETILKDKFVIVHHNALPNLVITPQPRQYLLLDKTGVFGNYTVDEILDLPVSVRNYFGTTSFAPKGTLSLLDEEM